MNSFTTKMIFPLSPQSHASNMVPLRALYVLPKKNTKRRIGVRTLLGRASFLPLIANTFNDCVVTPARLKQQFAFAGKVTAAVPLRQLSFPRGLELLPAVADAILSDLSPGGDPAVSGLVALFHLDGRPAERSILEQLSAPLKHRAVDGQKLWISGSAGLAFQHFRTTPESTTEVQPPGCPPADGDLL